MRNKQLANTKTTRIIDSLYIHIPFCQHICHYCDFPKMLFDDNFARQYLEAMFAELDSYAIERVATIYVGGGTPSSLPVDLLEKLLARIATLLKEGGEFTFEVNVENATIEKLEILKRFGVNRLSVGIESTDDDILKDLNRHHTFAQAVALIEAARLIGFASMNVDLIYGLPGQDEEGLKRDLRNLIALGVEHISTYALSVNPGTVFFARGVKEQDQDDSRRDYDLILSTLREAGYERYEVSNFAKEGFQSRHNLTYWRDDEYYGVGLGASGYIAGVRYDNTRSLKCYLERNYRSRSETISLDEDEKYYLMLNLRLRDGFEKADYLARYGYRFEEKHALAIKSAISDGLMLISDDRIRLSDEGLMILDRILLELI